MKIWKFLFSLSAVLICLFCTNAFADTAVIVHPSNGDAIDKDFVIKLYLGKEKSYPGGGSAIPINLKEGLPIRSGFDEGVLGKSSSQVKSYWSKLLFTGKGTPPKEVDTSAEAKALVAQNPSTIAYIDSSEVDASVKVLFTF